jgi:hypothetical protein
MEENFSYLFIIVPAWFALVAGGGALAGYFLAKGQTVRAVIICFGLCILLVLTFGVFVI